MAVAVTRRAYDNANTGVNVHESNLTAGHVQQYGVRRLFSMPLPGDARGAEAQPIIVPGIKLNDGQVHDLCIVATMANQIIAFDAQNGTLLWATTLGRPVDGGRAIDSWEVNDHWGVLSTPVADLKTGTLYACAWSSPDGSVAKAFHSLHAIELNNGQQSVLALNLEGATFDPGGGLAVQKFVSAARKQRCSLLLVNNAVFVGFGSVYESASTNRGWVIAIDVATWTISAAFCTAVNGSGGGIWQAGSGLSADNAGHIYCMTGNGSFDAKTEWGECFLKLVYTRPTRAGGTGKLAVVDWWSPFLDSHRAPEGVATEEAPYGATNLRRYVVETAIAQDWGDMDLGSGAPVVIDQLDIVLGAGKDGILYTLRKDAMGKTSPPALATVGGAEANYTALATPPLWLTFFPGWDVSPAPVDIRSLNRLFLGRTHHQHGSLIAWNSPQGWRLFCWGENGPLRMWAIETVASHVKVSYIASSEEQASPSAPVPPGGMPGGFMCLTSDENRPATAVLWACVPYGDANKTVTGGRLLAYDVNQFKEGPNGAVIPKIWDSADWGLDFSFCKFTPPVVANGRVYVPTYDGRIDVYG